MRFLYLFLAVSTLFLMNSTVSNAQNSVTVTQKGDGNKVSINQSSESSVAIEKPDYDCGPTDQQKDHPQNTITVTSAKSSPDTLLYKAGKPSNIVSVILDNLHKLEALQQGTGHALSILLPDSSESIRQLDVEQKQSNNTVSARFMDDAPSQISVSQDGNRNFVAINPCDKR